MRAIVTAEAKSEMTLIDRKPIRSTKVPPKKLASTVGRTVKNAIIPVLEALPVVTRTNQGMATMAMMLPMTDTPLAT